MGVFEITISNFDNHPCDHTAKKYKLMITRNFHDLLACMIAISTCSNNALAHRHGVRICTAAIFVIVVT
jgi:hypothetical protein